MIASSQVLAIIPYVTKAWVTSPGYSVVWRQLSRALCFVEEKREPECFPIVVGLSETLGGGWTCWSRALSWSSWGWCSRQASVCLSSTSFSHTFGAARAGKCGANLLSCSVLTIFCNPLCPGQQLANLLIHTCPGKPSRFHTRWHCHNPWCVGWYLL